MKYEVFHPHPDHPHARLKAYLTNHGGRPVPAVLIAPGGGYMGISGQEGEPVALRFAAMGYQTFVLEYTTLFGGFFEDLSDADPYGYFPGPLEDMAFAVKLIRKNAELWQVDPDRIALCGFSAGGHLAGCYAGLWQEPWLAEKADAEPESLRPTAVLLSYAVSDLVATRAIRKERSGGFAGESAMFQAVGGGESPSDEDLPAVSPAHLVGSHTPPMFLWHTASDDVVPCENALHMASALSAHQIPFELHVFENGPHGLGLADADTPGFGGVYAPECGVWVELAQKWLRRRFGQKG